MWLVPAHAANGQQNQDLTLKALVGSPVSPSEGLEQQVPLLGLCSSLILTFLVHHRCPQHINQLLPTEVFWPQQPWKGLFPRGSQPFAGALRLPLMPGKGGVSNKGSIRFSRRYSFLFSHSSFQILTNASDCLSWALWKFRFDWPHFMEVKIGSERSKG